MKDSISISLVNRVYKIIVKVLSNRLSMIMKKFISNCQNAFVKSRQIIDSILIANECLKSKLRFEKSRVLVKLDMKEAFDHVNFCLTFLKE